MKINTIYKYRPLSEFIFKELKYCELYFASYLELNDPLDLSTRINFKPKNEKQLEYLIYFLIKNSIIYTLKAKSKDGSHHIQKMIELSHDNKLKSNICNRLHSYLVEQDNNFVPYDTIKNHLKKICNEFPIEFNLMNFKDEVKRITKVFFESSYTTCFSESCTDFLMWSHYASKHTGICIGFSLNHEQNFPYFLVGHREPDPEKYAEKYSEWELKGGLYWDEINKVKYRKNLPSINFYDFAPVFENENDCDLMGLSKSYWHGYANELKEIYSVKTLPWKYEKEWRAIEINFGELKQPEERIRHYPIEAVTEICFGLRTPSKVKDRIYKIFNSKGRGIEYFTCALSNTRDLELREWKYCGE